MDSLSSMATSALAQVVRLMTTAESLRSNGLSIASILIECGGIRLALLQMQNLMLKDNGTATAAIFSKAVMGKYPAALSACSITFIALNEQLAKLGANGSKQKLGNRLRSLWRPSQQVQIETVCHNIRGQAIAIGFLLHALQSELTTQAFGLANEKVAGPRAECSTDARSADSHLDLKVADGDDISIASTLGDEMFHSEISDVDSAAAFLRVRAAMQLGSNQPSNSQSQSDLENTQIEVDIGSMTSLAQRLTTLESFKGKHVTSPKTRVDLESLIEDALCLFRKSPALLQISVRPTIVASRSIQYGYKKGSIFKTIITSKRIKGVLVSIAPYFNHFTKEGSTTFRTRLENLGILLLSLMNDVDLEEISSVIESTYCRELTRKYLEILFLKVLPFTSNTPKAFLQGLVFALEGHQLTGLMDFDSHIGQRCCWDACLFRLLDDGYLLPGSTNNLGRENFSWIFEWPEGGFKSTQILKRLQSVRAGPRAVVDISPDQLHANVTTGGSLGKSVIMKDGHKYSIQSSVVDHITSMTPGRYLLQEVGGSHANNLVIEKRVINSDTCKGIQKINKVIRDLKKADGYVVTDLPPECKWSGNIHQTRADINGKVLALNFKINAKDAYRIDVAIAMSQDIREGATTAEQILLRIVDAGIPAADSVAIQGALEKAKTDLLLAKAARQTILIADEFKLNSNPVEKVLKEERVPTSAFTDYWSDYKAWFDGVIARLHIEAVRSVVEDATWLSDREARISMKGHKNKYIVAPLAPVEDCVCYHDQVEGCPRYRQIHVGDSVILAGQYIIVADRLDNSKGDRGRGEFRMRNWLEVKSLEKPGCCNPHENTTGVKEEKILSIFY